MKRSGKGNTDGVHKTRRKPGRVRLKLRCDNNVPCEKCVSRGCGSICPNGTLTPGKGNRLVLTNTEELHDQIERLGIRIRELENALRILQASVSPDPHPLLHAPSGVLQPIISDETLLSPPAASSLSHNTLPTQESHVESRPPSADDESFVDAFGTLTLGRRGESSFFGQTARAELCQASSFSQSKTNTPPTRFYKRFAEPILLGPDPSVEGVGNELLKLLPQLPEAIRLCEVYREHGKYMQASIINRYAPIPRKELFDEILEPIYRADSFDAIQCYHVIAVLLGVFSLGALFDSDRQPFSAESQEYCYLARIALSCNPHVTRLSILGYALVAQYLFYSDCDYTNSNSAWMYAGHAVRLGHSTCTPDLDSSRWKLSQENIERRRRLFWQLFVLDTGVSFFFGRPPIMSSAYIDCPLPRETEDVITDGDMQISFHSWSQRWTVLLHSVMSTAFGAKQPSYSVIISLDRKIRDFPIPALWRPVCDDADIPAPTVPLELNMHRWLCMSRKEMTILSLHRPYFTQALKDMPTDLARHRYIPSVIAIYRSSWRIIEGLQLTWQRIPQALLRFNLAWSFGLAAAIVMCLLVTRAPTSNMTPSALAELDTVLKLFEEGAVHSRGVAKFLDFIRNLQRKAHESVDQTQSHSTPTITPSELDRLSGQTHLLADAGAPDSGDSGPSDSITHTEPLQGQSHTGPIEPHFFSNANSDSMHPTIAQDMSRFDMDAAPSNNLFLDFSAPAAMSGLRSPDISLYLTPNYQAYQPPAASHNITGVEPHQPAPVLDATWQSFVEQLGF
ncbi:hypothetical protein L208DRAFT_1345035 [Tricholoma matsutake]|nr:hypothetical protein L208DRAFT_1345035 [Tricholoma matsutake 945]